MKGAQTDRAIRAEARGRVLTTEICRGCGVSSDGQTKVRRSKLSGRILRQFRGRGTTISGPVAPLPLTSRAEAQIKLLNRQTAQQQQMLQFQQQTQFEINQLRNELQRGSELHRDYLFR
jgi:transposase-like protein